MLVHAIGESLSHFSKLALRLLLLELSLQRGAQFFKRRLAWCLDIRQQNDVVSKIGLHHVADLTLLHREHSIFERLHHRTAAKEVEISTGWRRTRVLR